MTCGLMVVLTYRPYLSASALILALWAARFRGIGPGGAGDEDQVRHSGDTAFEMSSRSSVDSGLTSRS